jgi:hypothetical protein
MAKVTHIETIDCDEEFYDFTVENAHNFYINNNPILVHNCHQAAAYEYSKVLNNIDVTYRIGLSATVNRNDGMTPVVHRIMGNVGVRSEASVMIPTLQIIETGIRSDAENATTRTTALSVSHKRNLLVLKMVFEDLQDDPDNCLFIPVDRVAHMTKLTGMINQQAAHDNAEARNKGKPEPWPYPLALSYSGATYDHKYVRTMASSKQIRVVVAVSKKVKHGISIPAWSIVYTGLAPIADGPGFYQMLSRVSTPPPPGETKPDPTVKHFIDSMPASARTFANLYNSQFNSLRDMIDTGKVAVSTATKERILQIVSRANSYQGPPEVAMSRKQKKSLGGFLGLSKRR